MDFNVYKFPAHALISLMSIIIFGGKKMQSGRGEKYFSSKHFIKIINEMKIQ